MTGHLFSSRSLQGSGKAITMFCKTLLLMALMSELKITKTHILFL